MKCGFCETELDPNQNYDCCPVCQTELFACDESMSSVSEEVIMVELVEKYSADIYLNNTQFITAINQFFQDEEIARLLSIIITIVGTGSILKLRDVDEADYTKAYNTTLESMSNTTFIPKDILKRGLNLLCAGLGLTGTHLTSPITDFIINDDVLLEYIGFDIKVVIPSKVSYIDSEAFRKHLNLNEVIFPEGLYFVPDSIFYKSNFLNRVEIPNSVTFIENCAFFDCSSLTEVVMSEKTNQIGDLAFFNCTNLMFITLPESVGYIGNGAFYNCDNLAPEIIEQIKAINPKALEPAIDNLIDNCVL